MSEGSDNPNVFCINRYGTTTSRLKRTNLNTPNNKISTNPPQDNQINTQQTSSPLQKKDTTTKLLPQRVSEISPNILFQHMDKPEPYRPEETSKPLFQRNKKSELPTNQPVQIEESALPAKPRTSGSKFQRLNIESNESTPAKIQDQASQKSPKNSETSSQAGARFTRKKPASPNPKIQPIDLSIQSSPRKGDSGTDRINKESSKKIERKPEKGRQVPLLNVDKRQSVDFSTKEDETKVNLSKITRQTPSNLTVNTSEEPVQTVYKPYRPIQRSKPQQDKQFPSKTQEKNQLATSNTTIIDSKNVYPARQVPSRSYIVETTSSHQQAQQKIPQVKVQPPLSQRKPHQYQNKNAQQQDGKKIESQVPDSINNLTPKTEIKGPIARSRVSSTRTPLQSTLAKNEESKAELVIEISSQVKGPITRNKVISSRGPQITSVNTEPSKDASKEDEDKKKEDPKPQPFGRTPQKLQNKDEVSTPASKPRSTTNNLSSAVNSLAGSQAVEKVILNRSTVVVLIIKRLLLSQLYSSFRAVKAGAHLLKLHLTAEALILSSSCSKIVKNKEFNLLKIGLDNLKRKLTASYIPELKTLISAPTCNPSQSAFNILHNLINSKLRSTFNYIKNKWKHANQNQSLQTLHQFVRRREKNVYSVALNQIKLRGHNRGQYFQRIGKISLGFWKNKISEGFQRLKTHQQDIKNSQLKEAIVKAPKNISKIEAPIIIQTEQKPAQSNPALIEKREKLKAISQSLGDNLQKLQTRLSELKTQASQQQSQRNERLSGLKQQNHELEVDLVHKRKRYDEVTKQLASLPAEVQQKWAVEQFDSSNHLSNLTNIFIANFKQQQETLSLEDLTNDYNLRTTDAKITILQQWRLLLQNSKLKQIIAAYQQNTNGPSKARRTLMAEQQMIIKLVRSYTREQYFWHWLHVSTETL